MLIPTWASATLGIACILMSATPSLAQTGSRVGVSPYLLHPDACPERCSISGPNPGNWSVYPEMKHIRHCKETMFYSFSVYDQVDDGSISHRIHACTSFGPDFSQLANSTHVEDASAAVEAKYEVGWWDEGFGLAESGIRSLTRQARRYLAHGHGAGDEPIVLFAQSGQATIGLYVGQSLQSQAVGSSALKIFEDNIANLNVTSPSLAIQFCQPDLGSAHSFGLTVASNGTFESNQKAVQTWANGSCLSFSQSTNISGQISYTAPVDVMADVGNSTKSSKSMTTRAEHGRRHQHLHARAECRTKQVDAGDSCAKLATKCGISASDFTKYNKGSNFCAQLVPKQYVCCSSGELPDLRPSKNSDGSCYAYTVKDTDTCASIAVENGLKIEDLEKFNKKTWGWSGCKRLFLKAVICLSDGSPPFPDPIANAQCGPQKPGTKRPTGNTDYSDLNPCPLNACCNIWGQCGITKDFCTDTNTGAPGTAKEGSYGCISNCGTDIVKGSGDGSVRIGYFQGYGMERDCLYQDASQIKTSKYTHIHFAFGTMTKDYDVLVGDKLSQYQFEEFKRLKGVKRILSFGGWDFSANPATYSIFREGVKPANRLKMANKIAAFIILNGLEGVDIDWEYPGAPDFPDIPAADKDEGTNYLAFLAILRNLLPGKSLSIAAPSSWWYLKQYPIKDIARVLDYIVYMTYDLHGQWDTENPHSQEGCDFGNCLRSQVNLTETQYSLSMITKAGVPSHKVIVGVTSFGRSFKMASAGCYSPDCLFTGNKVDSPAKKGKCTATGGYIADAEIKDIIKASGRVTKHYVDATSHSDILVYDDTEWVSYMSETTKSAREVLYKAWGMGGTTDWAVDLQEYHDAPKPAKSWAIFKEDVHSGDDPKSDRERSGNWTDYHCQDPIVVDKRHYQEYERWGLLQAPDAWKDAIRIYKEWDRPDNKYDFTNSIAITLKLGLEPDCRELIGGSCDKTVDCLGGMNSDQSGPAAQLIWASFVKLHNMFLVYDNALDKAVDSITLTLDYFGDKFAPVPEEDDNTYLFALIDLLTWGAATAAGPFFNSGLKRLPYFVKNSAKHDNSKDTVMTFIGQSTTLAKDLMGTSTDPWTPERMHSFAAYMAEVIKGWRKVNEKTLHWIFDGTDDAIEVLWSLISGGKLLGGTATSPKEKSEDQGDLTTNIEKTFYGYTIPMLWNVSSAYAFVLDSGSTCFEDYPVSDYVTSATADLTTACINDRRYYLVHPKGDSEDCECRPAVKCDCEPNRFSAPPGVEALDGSSFGGITVKNLIQGAVHTYENNGKKNVLREYDLTSSKESLSALFDTDVTYPGIVRLPVCSPERAYQSWDTAKKGSTPFYPCDIPDGKRRCEESSFENETSDKSPWIEDCEAIIRNIEGNGGTEWTIQVVGLNQRKIAAAGSCAFGIEATKADGNVQVHFGGQDMIDIINTSVKKYGKNGKIGAVGDLHCNGNIKQQPVHWAIYHT